MHSIVQRYEELKIDSRIQVEDRHYPTFLKEKIGGVLKIEYFNPKTKVTHVEWVDFVKYESTYTMTPDNKYTHSTTLSRVWTECEQHYGISHYGSKDPDPVRELALKILAGDYEAVHKAKNLLEKS